jgi:hypothetical protein
MSSEEYQATFPLPTPGQQQEENEETDGEASLSEKLQSLQLTSARVPFTAGEAWSTLTSLTSQQSQSTILQGITPSMTSANKRKKTTARGRGSSGSGTAATPTEIFIGALTRAGLVPLPSHTRAISEFNTESNSTGLAALQSRGAFFPPLPTFTSLIESTAANNDDDVTTTNAAGRGSKLVSTPTQLSISKLKYKKQQLKALAPPLSNTAAGSSRQTAARQRRELGIQMPELASNINACGHNVVFTPVVRDSGAESGPLVHVSLPGKTPSLEVSGENFFTFKILVAVVFTLQTDFSCVFLLCAGSSGPR